MSARQILEIIALAIQIISFPIATWSLYWARKEAKAARDLQIALDVWKSFTTRWEAGWRDAFYAVKDEQQAMGTREVPMKYRGQFFEMLNWIDWLGTLIRTKSLSETEIILGSIGPQFGEIIDIGEPLLEPYFEEHGRKYWKGLLRVAKELKAKELNLQFQVLDDD